MGTRVVRGLLVALVALPVVARDLRAQSCSEPYLVEQRFPVTGPEETRWRVCWQPTSHHGLRITSAHFRRAPNAAWMRVFWDARISEILVPYASGSRQYTSRSMGATPGVVHAADCPAAQGGVVIAGSVACRQVRPRGLAWRRESAPWQRQGEELLLWGIMHAAGHSYIVEWTFRDDGVVMGRLGVSGSLAGHAFGGHAHNAMWRLDVDLDGWTNDNVQVAGYANRPASGGATFTADAMRSEGAVDWDATRFTMLHLFDRNVRNARGHQVGYHLVPVRSGSARHQEPWTQHDFWVTKYHAFERQPDQLPAWVNGESIINADVVVWYWGSVLHLPRDEDGFVAGGVLDGASHVMWTGWMLTPQNLFDRVPLFP